MRAPRFPALEAWVHAKEVRACLPHTIHRYRSTVARALRALAKAHRPTDPSKWTLEDAVWIKRSIAPTRWAFSVLDDFARSGGCLKLREVGPPPRAPPSRVRWLTRDQVESIVEVTRPYPLLAIIALLGLGQGMRRVEWQRLRLDDIDLEGNRLLVRGKGRARPKLEWVPMHPAFPLVYRRYLAERSRLLRHSGTGPGLLPPSELLVHRSSTGLRPYSLSGLDRLVERIAELARRSGHPMRLSSHMFRRSGATLLEEALLSGPPGSPDRTYRVLQGFLRHENLATTMVYLESNPRRQERALRRFAEVVPWSSAGVPPQRGELVRRASEPPVSNSGPPGPRPRAHPRRNGT